MIAIEKSDSFEEKWRYVDAIRDVTGKEPSVDPSRFAGMLDPQICRMILVETGIDEDQLERYLPKIIARMSQMYKRMQKQLTLNRGVRELLDLLTRSPTYVLGVLTGNVAAIGREKLAAAGIEQYFRIGFFADNYVDRRRLVDDAVRTCVLKYELSERKNVVIVGDTPLDVNAANAAKATSIGIASGAYSTEALIKEGAKRVFQDLKPSNDLLTFLTLQRE